MELLKELKPIEEIEIGIEKLLAIDSSDDDAYKRMYNIISNELHPIPFPVIDLVPNLESASVFRARRNEGDQVFKYISEISSINDPAKIEKFGRCNIPGQSTFYCAENRPVANMEVINKEILDKSELIILTTGRWKINKRLRMAILIHGEKVRNVNPFIKERYEEFQKFLEINAIDKKPIIDRLLTFFADYFSRPFDDSMSNEYKLSAAFYNYILNFCNGLIYPSVKIEYVGLNYAFPHQRFIDEYIELDRAIITVLKKDENEGFTDSYATEDRGIMKEVDFIRWNKESLPYNKLNL